MHTPIPESKNELRRLVLGRIKALPPEQRQAASEQACARLAGQPVWKSARSVLFFAPLAEELDIWPLATQALAEGKEVVLPRFEAASQSYVACPIQDLQRDLQVGRWGIREPGPACAERALKRLDFILVPGVAFDLHGRRLGRGRGYYDQLLATWSGTTCGVGFDEQMVAEVPVEPHDRHLNCILTPTRWLAL